MTIGRLGDWVIGRPDHRRASGESQASGTQQPTDQPITDSPNHPITQSPLPITAIVIFRDERAKLAGCLAAVRPWCDELIAVDMGSRDGSAEAAAQCADRMFRVDPYPIAEPTRVAAARLARHDWVLLIDPDEHVPAGLVPRIAQTLAEHGDTAAAIRLPWWYYFKGRRLDGTVWGCPGGVGRGHKRMLIHRERCALLPYCNRITELKPGQHDVAIDHDQHSHVRHYWSESYRELARRHVTRYCHLEAAAQVAHGQRFGLGRALVHPFVELYRCLRHYDGWRLGPRGWLLSLIYFGYVLASDWLVLYYQRRSRDGDDEAATTPPIPELTEVTLPHRRDAARRAA